MAWTDPITYVKGNLWTAVLANLHLRDNLTALRAGGIAIAGQGTNHFVRASAATQLATLAPQSGKIPRFNGATNAWEMIVPAEAHFPIGIVYRLMVSTNPATLLGFGTWALLGPGKCTVCIDVSQVEFDTLGKTGGAKTHTLTIAELPSHTHTQDSHNHTQNPHGHGVSGIGNSHDADPFFLDFGTAMRRTGTKTTSSETATNNAATATNQNTGGGGAHNNVMPAIVCYVWHRTA